VLNVAKACDPILVEVATTFTTSPARGGATRGASTLLRTNERGSKGVTSCQVQDAFESGGDREHDRLRARSTDDRESDGEAVDHSHWHRRDWPSGDCRCLGDL